jgi:hypothetical protein
MLRRESLVKTEERGLDGMECYQREGWMNARHSRMKETYCPSRKLGEPNKRRDPRESKPLGWGMRGRGERVRRSKKIGRRSVGRTGGSRVSLGEILYVCARVSVGDIIFLLN